ncbi:hypothetical protein SUGI_0310700 [Cryptomeria japonica]|nr:hypothetical protein SUGI_0310700 [Cryptomeria japonica]
MITTDYFSSSPPLLSLFLPLFLISCSLFAESLAITSTAAYGGRTWRNNIQSLHFLTPSIYKDALVRPILLSSYISYNDMNLQFGCGFFCYGYPCDTGYLFATFFVIYTTDSRLFDMQMVWCANRDEMVQENAALTLTSTAELVLRNSDGTLVWSTNTSSQAFQRMAIHESGNLVVYNTSGGIIWQSFDYTTDTILPGQKFKVGQKITANISPKNTREGRFYGTLLHDGFAMFTASEPAKMYYRDPLEPLGVELSYSQFDNQSLNFYSRVGRLTSFNSSTPKGCLYFKLSSDGHIKFCSVQKATGRSSLDYSPWFIKSVLQCDSPGVCGDYGVCKNGQCSCPGDGKTFEPTIAAEPNSGCAPRVPLVCSQTSRCQGHHFLELEHVAYFTYLYENASTPGLVSRDECKTLCLENCSCKAAFFRYGTNFSSGYCYLESNIYSMTTMSPVDKFYNSTAYIKIQSTSKRFKSIVIVIICVSVGGAVALCILFWARIKGSQNRRQQKVKDEDAGEDDHVDWSAGLPLRFSFQELQDSTNGFSIKLGSGGFGSVYQGVLSDGSKIAVKRLHRAGHGEKGFRAEAEEGRLLDLVYPGLENEETGIKEEAVKLIKVGMWCVQDNFTRRPAMSIVVKALEGLIDTFNDVPCALPGSTVGSYKQSLFSAELSVLSGPR